MIPPFPPFNFPRAYNTTVFRYWSIYRDSRANGSSLAHLKMPPYDTSPLPLSWSVAGRKLFSRAGSICTTSACAKVALGACILFLEGLAPISITQCNTPYYASDTIFYVQHSIVLLIVVFIFMTRTAPVESTVESSTVSPTFHCVKRPLPYPMADIEPKT